MSEIPSGVGEEEFSHQTIDESREQFDQEHNLRAEERNRYRTIWQKMFGLGKTTDMDIVMEEALKMDAAVEKEINEGRAKTIEEALNNVDQMPEFQLKGEERVGKEEYAEAKALQAGRAITENQFGKATLILGKERFRKGVDQETAQLIDERVSGLVKEQVANLARSRDGKNLVSAIYWFDSRLKPEDLPPDAISSPEIAQAVKEHAVSWLRAFYNESSNGIAKEWEKFSRLGLLNKEEVIQDQDVQQFAQREVTSYFRAFYNEPRTFTRIRDNFVRLGIGTIEEYSQLPEIQEIARKEAIGYFRTFSYDPETYMRIWKNFENLGILSVEQIKALPEIAGDFRSLQS